MLPFRRRSARSSSARTALATVALVAAGALTPVGVSAAHAGGTGLPDPLSPTTQAQKAKRPTGFRFRLATFNILGSQHTRGSARYASGSHRAGGTARLIKDKRIGLIGMQEVQTDQYRVLHRRLDGYGIWPGLRLGNQGIRLQIAWRKSLFEKVGHGTITTRFDHQSRPIPWVRLRNRHTDRRIYLVDIHNSPQGQEGERDAATRKEIRLIKRLRSHHRPVFVVGDMNEKEEWFCKVVGHTDLHAANGGHATPRRCRPPDRQLRIDWLMGGRRVDFSRYREDDGRRVRRTSDHEFVHARVRVLPKR